MNRIARVLYQRRTEVLIYLVMLWVALAVLTRNPAEALVLTVYISPIALLVYFVVIVYLIGVK
jgi:hypothetical protein